MEADVTHSVMLFNDCILWHFAKKTAKTGLQLWWL